MICLEALASSLLESRSMQAEHQRRSLNQVERVFRVFVNKIFLRFSSDFERSDHNSSLFTFHSSLGLCPHDLCDILFRAFRVNVCPISKISIDFPNGILLFHKNIVLLYPRI